MSFYIAAFSTFLHSHWCDHVAPRQPPFLPLRARAHYDVSFPLAFLRWLLIILLKATMMELQRHLTCLDSRTGTYFSLTTPPSSLTFPALQNLDTSTKWVTFMKSKKERRGKKKYRSEREREISFDLIAATAAAAPSYAVDTDIHWGSCSWCSWIRLILRHFLFGPIGGPQVTMRPTVRRCFLLRATIRATGM